MERTQKLFFSSMLLAVCLISVLASTAPPSTLSHKSSHAEVISSSASGHREGTSPTKPHRGVNDNYRTPIPTFIAAIASPTDFCFFLPPDPKAQSVAEAEDRAVAYCTKDDIPGTTGARVFPPNFIVASHFKKNESAGWVQVTGLINPTVYGMSMSDDGGQYDIKAPLGASCVGYSSFVNLVEPSSSRFCIRCCQTSEDCNVKISEYGCERIVPGNYKLGGDVTSHLIYPQSIGMTEAEVQVAEAAIAKNKSHSTIASTDPLAPSSDGAATISSVSGHENHGTSTLDQNKSKDAPPVVSAASIRGVQWQSLLMVLSLMGLGASFLVIGP